MIDAISTNIIQQPNLCLENRYPRQRLSIVRHTCLTSSLFSLCFLSVFSLFSLWGFCSSRRHHHRQPLKIQRDLLHCFCNRAIFSLETIFKVLRVDKHKMRREVYGIFVCNNSVIRHENLGEKVGRKKTGHPTVLLELISHLSSLPSNDHLTNPDDFLLSKHYFVLSTTEEKKNQEKKQ